MPLIRYPGSKAKLVDAIVGQFPAQMQLPLWMDAGGWEYREPFFGSGAIGFEVLRRLPPRCSAWLGDMDYGITALWNSVMRTPVELCELIEEFEPSADAFFRFKEEDGRKDIDPIQIGFRKLALHLMSYSGLGAKAGGPLGGKGQTNPLYTADCRWAPEHRQREILELHDLLTSRRVKITTGDFSKMFADQARNAFVYCDPPYVDKGPELYKFSFDEGDHERLARYLLACKARGWVVSYDDHGLIRALYSGRRIVPVDITYSIAVENESRRKNQEILITNEAA